jgi:hypothetical protein
MQEKYSESSKLGDLFRRFTRVSERKKITLNKRVLIFFFFLMLSVVFWLLTALNKEYTHALSYPVRFIRFPEDKVLVSEVPDRLELRVNASGFVLLSYQLRSRLTPIIFDVNSFSANRYGNDPSSFYILSSLAKDGISRQLSNEIGVLDIKPDTLIFRFASRIDKKVAVIPSLELQFEKQYMQTGPTLIEPDSVILSGPQVIVDTIQAVYTEMYARERINESFSEELKLFPVPRIDFNPVEVWLQVPVEKFTTARLQLPIEVVNLPDSLVIRTFPGKVDISCQVGLSAYESLSEHQFSAVVDYSEAASMIGSKLQVRIVKVPENIQALNYTPKSVEYILEK